MWSKLSAGPSSIWGRHEDGSDVAQVSIEVDGYMQNTSGSSHKDYVGFTIMVARSNRGLQGVTTEVYCTAWGAIGAALGIKYFNSRSERNEVMRGKLSSGGYMTRRLNDKDARLSIAKKLVKLFTSSAPAGLSLGSSDVTALATAWATNWHQGGGKSDEELAHLDSQRIKECMLNMKSYLANNPGDAAVRSYISSILGAPASGRLARFKELSAYEIFSDKSMRDWETMLNLYNRGNTSTRSAVEFVHSRGSDQERAYAIEMVTRRYLGILQYHYFVLAYKRLMNTDFIPWGE